MKTKMVTSVFLVVVLLATVHGIPQGEKAEEEKQEVGDGKPEIGDRKPFENLEKVSSILKRLREQFPQQNLDWQKAPSFQLFNRTAPGGFGINAVYNTLLSGVHSLYQDLLNRQQAFINLLTCGNCLNDGWNAIMEVALTVPELEWVYKPSSGGPSTFFTAVNQNGTVTGIGGSIVNDKPVAEYAFGNDGIVQHLPKKDKKH